MQCIIMYAGTSKRIVNSVGTVLVGHFSVDGNLKGDHFNFRTSHNMIIVEENAKYSPAIGIYSDVINKFSYTGQTVVAAMKNEGM